MKKLLFILASCLCFLWVSLADYLTTWMTITLNPWWNVVSTPTVLSDVSFSNWWDWISFMYLEWTEWKNTTITSSNVASVFKPLEWFLVKNNNSQDVQMTLWYDMNIDISGVMREKEIRAWWNFLWITKTTSPFQNIASTSASIIVDFSKKSHNWASISYMKENPTEYEIGKAYWVFADQSGIYGWLTSFSDNIDCNDANVIAACAIDSVNCPKKCGISIKNTVLRKNTWIRIAELLVNYDSIDTIKFTLTGSTALNSFDEDSITLDIGNTTIDVTLVENWSDYVTYTANPYIGVPSEWTVVDIIINGNILGKVSVIWLEVNGIPQPKTFSKYFVETLVSFDSLDDAGAATYTYKFDVDGGADKTVSNFIIYTTTWSCVADLTNTSLIKATAVNLLSDGDTVSVKRVDAVQEICGVTYEIANVTAPDNIVSIDRVTYPDYFKIAGKTIAIPKA